MKKILFYTLLFLFIPYSVYAFDFDKWDFSTWNKEDKIQELIWQGLNIADFVIPQFPFPNKFHPMQK